MASSLSTRILTVMSRCKHFRIATNLGGHPICFMMTYRALRFAEPNDLVKSTKAMV